MMTDPLSLTEPTPKPLTIAVPASAPPPAITVLARLSRADRAVYRAVAGFSTPVLDRPLRTISDAANHSKPWFAIAAALALFGGSRGDRRRLPVSRPSASPRWW